MWWNVWNIPALCGTISAKYWSDWFYLQSTTFHYSSFIAQNRFHHLISQAMRLVERWQCIVWEENSACWFLPTIAAYATDLWMSNLLFEIWTKRTLMALTHIHAMRFSIPLMLASVVTGFLCLFQWSYAFFGSQNNKYLYVSQIRLTKNEIQSSRFHSWFHDLLTSVGFRTSTKIMTLRQPNLY